MENLSPLKPGPRDHPIQCYIRREKATSTYRLYLGLTPAPVGENGELLLAARKVWKVTGKEFVISLAADDFSRVSDTYIGKLRSNFLGNKFTIYDSQAPCNFAGQSSRSSNRRIHSKQVSPRVAVDNDNVGSILYQVNLSHERGPRRMQCILQSIPISALQEGGTVPTPTTFLQSLEEQDSLQSDSKSKANLSDFGSTSLMEPLLSVQGANAPLVLKNKAPYWYKKLGCWALDFKGRVIVSSVKNFQLVAAVEPSHNVSQAELEKVILQFGKTGEDIFTMDYRYPLSAFQAFAISLSSFDTKLLCE